jgi:hypothetical protein
MKQLLCFLHVPPYFPFGGLQCWNGGDPCFGYIVGDSNLQSLEQTVYIVMISPTLSALGFINASILLKYNISRFYMYISFTSKTYLQTDECAALEFQ